MTPNLSIYLVTDSGQAEQAGWRLVDLALEAAAGGVTCIQVREKNAGARAFLDEVTAVAAAVPPQVPVLVNDRVDVFLAARDAGARVAGVHVGQSDLPPHFVRRLIGPDAVLGLSAATEKQLAEAAASEANVTYVGIGALHETTTKKDAPEPLGLARFRELVRASELPAVAIGGVTADDMASLREAGAAGGAVVSAICASADPRRAAEELTKAWARGRTE